MRALERERSHTDIEFSDYLDYPASIEEVRAGIESWLREAIVIPFEYIGEIRNGVFRAFGQSMVEMAEHGLGERVGQVGQLRAEADLTGVSRMEKWLREEAADGDLLILLSPPGTEEEGFGANGQRRLSFTQFGFVRKNEAKTEIRMISLPEREVSIETHIGRITAIWQQESLRWYEAVEKTDRGLVAMPLTLHAKQVKDGVEKYVKMMGKEGWSEIEQELSNGLRIDNDEYSLERRESLIGTITWQVRRYIEERNAERLNNIGLAARVVMAREATGKYLGWTQEMISKEYSEIEGAMWFRKQYTKRNTVGKIETWLSNAAEVVWANQVISRLQLQLSNEREVREILLGSSCGGGGFEGLWGGNNVGRFGSQIGYMNGLAIRALGISQRGETTEVSEKMRCVKCPFCNKTVDAEVTVDKIKCPECKAQVSRS